MVHRAWSSIVEVPYCFSRSYVKFQGHTALKIIEFDPNWAFPDSNSSLNSPMAMKCRTKLETAKERCPIVFQGHPSNFKVTRDKTSPILTQIGRFRIIGRSQLSNPSDLPCWQSSHYTPLIYIIVSRAMGSYLKLWLQNIIYVKLSCPEMFVYKIESSAQQLHHLINWDRDNMAAIFQRTFSNTFPWLKMRKFRLRFLWSFFLRVQLTIFLH